MVRQRPLSASHSLAVLSRLPLTRKLPSELKVTPQTTPWCPLNVLTHCPLSISHSLIVLSGKLWAKRRPSGRKASAEDSPVGLDETRTHWPLPSSHRQTLP